MTRNQQSEIFLPCMVMRYFSRNDLLRPKNSVRGLRFKDGIILNEQEWFRISNYGKIKQREREQEEDSLKKKELKRELSLEMSAKWENTLAKLKELKRENELREVEKIKEEKLIVHKKMLKRRKKENERILREASRLVYESKSTTKQLLSGAALSAILEERNRQVEFNIRLRTKTKEKLVEQTEQYKRQNLFLQRQLLEEKLQKQKMKCQVRRELDKQINEVVQKKQRDEWEKEKEKQARRRRNFLLQQTEREEREKARKSKEELKLRIENYLKSEEDIKREKEKMEKLENEMRGIVQDTAQALEKKRKAREKIFDSSLRTKCLEMFEKHRKELEDKANWENEKILAEKAEKDVRKLQELLKLKKRREELEQERVADRERAEEEIQKKKAEDKVRLEKVKRERLEKTRCDELWAEAERRRRKEAKLNLRAALRQQWEEAEERRREKEKWMEWEKLCLRNLEKEKEDMVTYCEYILNNARRLGRPLFPVFTAIRNVKMECGILQPKKNIQHLQSKIPIYGFKPKN